MTKLRLRHFALTLILCASLGTYASVGYGATVLVFGDSFSSSKGVEPSQSWVNLLQSHLGNQVEVHNDSVEGRLLTDSSLEFTSVIEQVKPIIVLLALGINDANQKIAAQRIQDKFRELIEECRRLEAIPVVLITPATQDLNTEYAQRYQQALELTALRMDVAHRVWFEASSYRDEAWTQADSFHPSKSAQKGLYRRALDLLDPHLALN